MEFEIRKKYYNLCMPYEALEPGDERNIDFDSLFPQDKRPRGVNWTERLAGRIELSDHPVCLLFTGLPGSGKSTELKRLAERLSENKRANLLPVVINAEEVVDISNPIDVTDIMACIVDAAERAVLHAEGKDPNVALQDGYLTRFWGWLTETDLRFKQGELQVPAAGKLVIEMKTRPTLRNKVREIVAAHFTSFLNDARNELTLLNGRAAKLGRKGLVVFFDSLEKLRGITTNWHDVLASAEKLFSGGAPYLQLPVHVLYTVPTALVSRAVVGVDAFLPMIKIRNRMGEPFDEGKQAARQLIRRRIPDRVMEQLLGPAYEEKIGKMIEWSGGYPRELVRLLQSVIAFEDHPVPPSEFNRICNEVSDSYRKIVPANAFGWLAGVAVNKYYTIEDDDHRQIADQMLSNNVVLRYLNDQEWFDLHPSVYSIPGVAEEIEKSGKGPIHGGSCRS